MRSYVTDIEKYEIYTYFAAEYPFTEECPCDSCLVEKICSKNIFDHKHGSCEEYRDFLAKKIAYDDKIQLKIVSEYGSKFIL